MAYILVEIRKISESNQLTLESISVRMKQSKAITWYLQQSDRTLR